MPRGCIHQSETSLLGAQATLEKLPAVPLPHTINEHRRKVGFEFLIHHGRFELNRTLTPPTRSDAKVDAIAIEWVREHQIQENYSHRIHDRRLDGRKPRSKAILVAPLMERDSRSVSQNHMDAKVGH